MDPRTLDELRRGVAALAAQTVAWRRDFHRHAEVAYQETRTARRVREILEGIGCDSIRTLAETGLRAEIIGGGGPGRTIALRSDMDALPMTETPGREYGSENPGACHACGHDGHMAGLLAAAKVLAERRALWRGRVVLLFQPAEEAPPGGAGPMIRDGALEGVDAIFGVHLWQPLPTGKVGLVKGPMMAASDNVDVVVRGKGGHAALPQDAVDPVLAAAHAVAALQSIVSRNVDPLQAAVVSICRVEGGTAYNIIPDEVRMSGTARSFVPAVRDLLERRIGEVAAATAAAFGAEAETRYVRGFPPVVNDPRMIDLAERVTAAALGPDRAMKIAPVMGGEDFALYLQERPGAFLFVGAGTGMPHPHHHPGFDIDERALPDAALLLAALAVEYLSD